MAKKILIVDDDKEDRLLIEAALKAAEIDCDITSVGDGEACLNIVNNDRPDLIILDVMMPDIEGTTVCGILKYDEKSKSIPIIMLTAHNSLVNKDISRVLKADAFIPKSPGFSDLIKEVKSILFLDDVQN